MPDRRIRVYLITFRRAALLARAIESLRRQTHRDWICEVQNGDPADLEPARLLRELRDPRFTLRSIPERIGPVAAFNLAHTPAPEPYQSILEDDNWWEPTLLERLVAELERHPEVELAWSNMRTWREQTDGSWRETGDCVWRTEPGAAVQVFHWPHLLQFNDMIYSNGCMLLRSRSAAALQMPADTPRDMIEHVRERMMSFPILLVPEPLANFAITLGTFRSRDFAGWGSAQALLGAAYLRHVPMSVEAGRRLWAHRRAMRPQSTAPLFFAAMLAGSVAFLWHARPRDWLLFFRGIVRRPGTAARILAAKRRHPSTWKLLCELTAARTTEARARGFVAVSADSLLDKQNPPFGPHE